MATVLGQQDFAEAVLTLPGDLPRQVLNEFSRGWHLREVLAEKEQAAVAAASPEQSWVDGLGQVTMQITPDAYHFWGHKLGYGCWKDKAFRREFGRDNPSVRVRNVARKTMLQVEGFRR